MITYRWIKIAFWILPLGLLGWLVNELYVPFGRMTAVYDVVHTARRIVNFASKEPTTLIGYLHDRDTEGAFQLITASPVYFRVLARRPFESARVTLEYQNPDAQPELSVGVRQRNGAYTSSLLVANQQLINQIPRYWKRIDAGSMVLFQRDRDLEQLMDQSLALQRKEIEHLKQDQAAELRKLRARWTNGELTEDAYNEQRLNLERQLDQRLAETEQRYAVPEEPKGAYASVEAFLAGPPDPSRIVQYNYELSSRFRLPGYSAQEGGASIAKAIRGKHELLTYIRDETLDFTFTVRDINRHDGADPFRVRVRGPSGVVTEKELPDDGIDTASGEVEPERRLNVRVPNLPEGVYRLNLETNDDVFVSRIDSAQHLLVFRKSLYLADHAEYRSVLGDRDFGTSTIVMDGTKLDAYTSHAAGRQILRVGQRFLDLADVGRSVGLSNLTGLTQITVPQNDVKLDSDGYFAFSEAQYFDPHFSNITELTEVSNLDGFDYLIADYPQPVQQGAWLQAVTTLKATDLYFNPRKSGYEFGIFLPRLGEEHRTLRIRSVKIEFSRPPITLKRIVDKIDRVISR